MPSAVEGGAQLIYWRESQGTVSSVLKDTWTPRSEGSSTVNDPWVPVANVVPDITSSTVSYFAGPFVAGRYRVNYVAGALQYAGGLWGLNAGAPYGFRVVHSGGAATIEGPYTTYTQQVSQAAVEAANAGATVEFDHAGGTIGVYLQDTPYGDNDPGTPNPTFELVGLPTTIDTPVHVTIPARGQGGMVLADGISAAPAPVLGKLTQRWAGGYDFQGGNAAFAGRVSGANPVNDQDFVTQAWLNTRYFNFSAWTPSYGTYGARDFSKWIPSSVVGTDADAVLSPKGTGAISGQQPDGLTSGGDARGENAVDFQLSRLSATQVASGNNAGILCGTNNGCSGARAVVCGGNGNEAVGADVGVVAGYSNLAEGSCSAVLAGEHNGIYGGADFGAIVSGSNCTVGSAIRAVILGGYQSTIASGANYGMAWGNNAVVNHAAALVFSSENSGGATSELADQATFNFAAGYRFQGGAITQGAWQGTTVGIAWGGTGASSFTPNAVVCGGAASSTDPLQTVASVGTAGQVLTSNGAGALPTWQAASGGGLTLGKLHAVNAGIGF